MPLHPLFEFEDDSQPWLSVFDEDAPALPCEPCDLCCKLMQSSVEIPNDHSPFFCDRFFYRCSCAGELVLERQLFTLPVSGEWSAVPQVNFAGNGVFYLPSWLNQFELPSFPFITGYRYRLKCTLPAGEVYYSDIVSMNHVVERLGCMQSGEFKFYRLVLGFSEFEANWNGSSHDLGAFVGSLSTSRPIQPANVIGFVSGNVFIPDIRELFTPVRPVPGTKLELFGVWSQNTLSDQKCIQTCAVTEDTWSLSFDNTTTYFLGTPQNHSPTPPNGSFWRLDSRALTLFDTPF